MSELEPELEILEKNLNEYDQEYSGGEFTIEELFELEIEELEKILTNKINHWAILVTFLRKCFCQN